MESNKDEETRSLLPPQPSNVGAEDKKKNAESSIGISTKESSVSDSSSTSEYRVDDSKNTYFVSLMAFLRTLVGTGVLSLPIALKYTGLGLGPILIVITAVLTLAAFHFTVDVVSKLHAKFGGKIPQDLELPEATYYTFNGSSLKIFQRLAFPMRFLIASLIVILNVMLCSIFHLFVATNLQRFVLYVLPPEDAYKVPSLLAFEVALLALLIPFVFVRRLDLLGHFLLVANILATISLALIITYCIIDLPKWMQVHDYPLVASMDTIPIGFGIIIFAFNGIQLLLSIRNRMINPNLMSTLLGILNVTLVITTVFNLGVGLLGYLRFGDKVESTITLNMPRDQLLFLLAIPLFAIAIFFTYGLFFYLIALIVVEAVAKSNYLRERPHLMTLVDAIIRVTFVLIIFVGAAFVPYIDLLVALSGSLIGAFLNFSLPAVVHAVSFTWGDDSDESEAKKTGTGEKENGKKAAGTKSSVIGTFAALTVDVVLIVVGVIASTVGTYAAIIYIIRAKQRA